MNARKLWSGLLFFFMTVSALPWAFSTLAKADTWRGLEYVRCMADEWEFRTAKSLPHDIINCTANDVEITKVIPRDAAGNTPDDPLYEPVECSPGELIRYPNGDLFEADITVRTNASERYDPTFYLPLTPQSPQYVQVQMQDFETDDVTFNDGYCSMILPMPPMDPLYEGAPANANIDGDKCSDITKAYGPDEYVLESEPLNMICLPSADDPTRAEFTYCAAWSVDNDGTDCSKEPSSPGQIPSQKSKCKCGSFPIDVFIKPDPPTISKTLISTDSRTEFGGDYTFKLSFTNPSESASVYIEKLVDVINANASVDGIWDGSLDLLDPAAVTSPMPLPAQDGSNDGVYLAENSDCITKFLATDIDGEILAGDTFTCQFTIHIIDTALPNLNEPELYDDAVKVLLKDKNNDPVLDGDSCSNLSIEAADGEHCSNKLQVKVTNLMPDLTVSKNAKGQVSGTNSITEPGEKVDFTVTVSNPKSVERLQLIYLHDLQSNGSDLDLNGRGTCATGGWIEPLGSYSCTFSYYVSGNAADKEKWDTVTAKLADNEGNVAEKEDKAMVEITDTPSTIRLDKVARESAAPSSNEVTELYEPGDWVYYHFRITNTSAVDTVYIDTLEDVINDSSIPVDLTVDPDGDGGIETTCSSIADEIVLAPGAFHDCYYYVDVLGNAGFQRHNLAEASGYDDDYNPVSDKDDHTIAILNKDPAASLTKKVTDALVTYEVVVTNESSAEELFITKLDDDKFGDITSVHDAIEDTDCSLSSVDEDGIGIPGGGIAIGGTYICTFKARVETSESPHTDTVTGTIEDDDGYKVFPSDSATVKFE